MSEEKKTTEEKAEKKPAIKKSLSPEEQEALIEERIQAALAAREAERAKEIQGMINAAVAAGVSAALAAKEEAALQRAEPPLVVLSRDEFETLPPEKTAGKYVTKTDFIALTPLSEMNRDAAEGTYGRWLGSGRIQQRVTKVLSDGTVPDKIETFVEARFVYHERRKANVNKRVTEETREAGFDVRPFALRK